jgi:hypothetical protein
MAKQATDTFVAVLKDGTEATVAKGQVFADNHVIVKHAPGLFADFDLGEESKPARVGRKASS